MGDFIYIIRWIKFDPDDPPPIYDGKTRLAAMPEEESHNEDDE